MPDTPSSFAAPKPLPTKAPEGLRTFTLSPDALPSPGVTIHIHPAAG